MNCFRKLGLAVMVLMVLVHGSQLFAGELKDKCRNFRLQDTLFIAECKNDDGQFVSSSFDLANHVGLDTVVCGLRWGEKNFQDDCESCRIMYWPLADSISLECICSKGVNYCYEPGIARCPLGQDLTVVDGQLYEK